MNIGSSLKRRFSSKSRPFSATNVLSTPSSNNETEEYSPASSFLPFSARGIIKNTFMLFFMISTY